MAEILFSSSFDEKCPPNNIFSSSNSQFWSSTGLYPQELDISLNAPKTLSEIQIVSYNIKSLMIEICENDSAAIFKVQFEQHNIQQKEKSLQNISCHLTTKSTCKIIKLTILEGYNDFCTIHNINFK